MSTSTPPAEQVKPNPYAAIAGEGPHETAAYAALPAALTYIGKMAKQQGTTVPDLSAAKPVLVAYTLRARVGKQSVLFEVRADGDAYELYRYPKAPDPAKLLWMDAALDTGARTAAPEGTGELAAAAAVSKVVEQAKPGKKADVVMHGYTFYWILPDGTPVLAKGGTPFTVSLDPSGAAASWST